MFGLISFRTVILFIDIQVSNLRNISNLLLYGFYIFIQKSDHLSWNRKLKLVKIDFNSFVKDHNVKNGQHKNRNIKYYCSYLCPLKCV